MTRSRSAVMEGRSALAAAAPAANVLDSVVRVRPLGRLGLNLFHYSLQVRNLIAVGEKPIAEATEVGIRENWWFMRNVRVVAHDLCEQGRGELLINVGVELVERGVDKRLDLCRVFRLLSDRVAELLVAGRFEAELVVQLAE
jgi:hypothetical protein